MFFRQRAGSDATLCNPLLALPREAFVGAVLSALPPAPEGAMALLPANLRGTAAR